MEGRGGIFYADKDGGRRVVQGSNNHRAEKAATVSRSQLSRWPWREAKKRTLAFLSFLLGSPHSVFV